MVDNRGKSVEPGAIVAYNLSGQIAKGRVLSVGPSRSRYRRANIRIELLHRAAGQWPGHVSNVTDPLNVLVLHCRDA